MWSWLAIFDPAELPVRGFAGHPWLDANAASRERAATIPPSILRSSGFVPSLLGATTTVCRMLGPRLEEANFIRAVYEAEVGSKGIIVIDVRSWHFSDIPPALTNVCYRG
jgi:hypothetical protein